MLGIVHRSARLALAGLLVFAACSAPAREARAAGPEEAEADALIAQGVALREHGKDDEALAVFKKALASSASPRARAQVALAEQALGLWVPAESDLLLALGATSDLWISKNRGALEGALATVRRRLGSLEVRGTEGAEVFLDGVGLGVLPVAGPFRIEAGRRTLEIRAKGFHATTRSIEVPAGGISRETVTLVALAPESPGGPSVAATAKGAASSPLEPAASDVGGNQRLVGWIFTGTGAALLITGGVGLLVRKGIVDDYNIQCPGLGVGQPADCGSKIELAKTWLTASVVTLIGGGLFTLGGLTLVATAPRRDAAAPGRVSVGCAPSPANNGASLTCAGSF